MRKRPPLRLSFDYMDTAERRVLSLENDGILCMPVLGFDCYRRKWEEAPLHVHEECLEISLCLRGDLEFESGKPVAATAHHLGFSSSQHFSSQFKSVVGFTPKGWCRQRLA